MSLSVYHLFILLLLLNYTAAQRSESQNNFEYSLDDDCINEESLMNNFNSTMESIAIEIAIEFKRNLVQVKNELLNDLKLHLVTKEDLQDLKNQNNKLEKEVSDLKELLEAGFEETYTVMKEGFGEGIPDLKSAAKNGFNSLKDTILSELSSIREDVEQLRGEHKDDLEGKITALNSTLMKALSSKASSPSMAASKMDFTSSFSCDNSVFLNVPSGLDVCGEVVSQGQCGQNLWYLYHCCRSCQAAGMVPDGVLPINRAWDRTVDYSRG